MSDTSTHHGVKGLNTPVGAGLVLGQVLVLIVLQPVLHVPERLVAESPSAMHASPEGTTGPAGWEPT